MVTKSDKEGTVRLQVVMKPEERQKIKIDAAKAGFPNVTRYIMNKLGLNGKPK